MTNRRNKLRKALGLKDIIFLAMGVILGAGIYAIIGEAAALAGNMLWLAFIVAAVIAMLSALSYAEFVSRFPDAGGSFEYIKRAFNTKIAIIFGIATILTGIIASAAIAISFADYFSRLWQIPNNLAITGIVVVLGFISIIGIKHSSITNIIATIITILGLIFVIVLGIPKWGEAELLKMPANGFMGIFAAGALTFFSYVGFEDVVKTSEETKNPRITVSKGILLAGVFVTIIYVLVSISAIALASHKELAGSTSPLAYAVEGAVGRWGVTALIIVALFATSNSILTNILATARLLFDIARDTGIKWMTKLSIVNKKSRTPILSTILIIILVILFALIGNLKVVASISNFFIFSVFMAVNISLIYWRYRNPNAEKSEFYLPLNIKNIPLTAILATISLLVLMIFNILNIVKG
ncbi:MAG: APC family permease [Candidatus Zixiibacteriota bacterium]